MAGWIDSSLHVIPANAGIQDANTKVLNSGSCPARHCCFSESIPVTLRERRGWLAGMAVFSSAGAANPLSYAFG